MTGRRVLAIVLVLVLLLLGGTGLAAQSEIDLARDKAAEAAKRSEVSRELAAEAEIDVLNSVAAIESANAQLVLVELAAQDLERRIELTEAERQELLGAVQVYAIQSYLAQGPADITFLASGDLTEAAEMRMFVDLISGFSLNDIDRFRVLTQDLEASRVSYDAALVSQTELLAELENQNAAMGQALAAAQLHVREAEAAEAEFEAEVAKLEEQERLRLLEEHRKAEEQRIKREQERRQKLEEEQRKADEERRRQEEERQNQSEDTNTTTTVPRPPVIIGDGTLLCPIAGLTHFSDTWGAARSGGRRHQGVDMFAERGTPVVAVVAGSVRLSDSGLGGKGFWLTGDDGHTYFGSHLDSFSGVSGRVEAGAVLGTVGNTGNARFASPHLHFEVHPGGGAAVNPYPTTKSACGK